MLPQTFTHLGCLPATSRPRSWQNYLSRLVAILFFSVIAVKSYAQLPTFLGDQITINAVTTAATTTTTYNGPTTNTVDKTQVPDFNAADLGRGNKFDVSNGSLQITVVSDTLGPNYVVYDKKGNPSIQTGSYKNSYFHYRVYLQGTTVPPYTDVQLSLTSSSNSSSPTTYAGTSIDLFATPRSLGGGAYQVDAYFDATLTSVNGDKLATDPGNGATNPISATFTVNAPAVTPNGSTTRWISTSNNRDSTNWFNVNNWSNGVPNGYSDAIIPEAATGSKIVFPILSDITKNYRVRNLTLEGTSASGKAQLTIDVAVLHVYGNITQEASGLVGTTTGSAGVADSTKNSTLILAGKTQIISTGNLVVPDVIAAGSDYKYVLGNLNTTNTLSFRPTDPTKGVIVMTASLKTDKNGQTYYGINTTGTPKVNLVNPSTGINAQNGIINGNAGSNETTVSFVEGYLTTGGTLVTNNKQSFGNIGLELIPNHTTSVSVTRIIGDPLKGPTNNGNQPVPIQRQYQITGDDDSTTGAYSSSSNTVIFHYLPSVFELNGIKQKNLTMFLTTTGNSPYTPVGGILDSLNYTVVQSNISSFKNYYYTLGDKTNPLPVSLVAFGATRSGANTLLSWTTASEERNTGFNVQVSTDGTNFRTLSFVSSKSPNSSTTLNYQYTDTEAGKAGTRYYRLEQVDEGGAKSYSPVRLVNFSGTTTGTGALVAYPNPFNEGVSLTLDGGTVADGTAVVKLVDMTGRTVRESKLSLVGASLTLNDVGTLRSGLYLAKVTLPDGSTQTVRISKQ